jgi:hypothetical protein
VHSISRGKIALRNRLENCAAVRYDPFSYFRLQYWRVFATERAWVIHFRLVFPDEAQAVVQAVLVDIEVFPTTRWAAQLCCPHGMVFEVDCCAHGGVEESVCFAFGNLVALLCAALCQQLEHDLTQFNW